ncbi:MAG: hypothetical protein PHV20_06415 [Bacteroidales bacterium]|nr:hypothetical protein [Bacteroidales bacterium]
MIKKILKIVAILLFSGYAIVAAAWFYQTPKKEICKEMRVEIADANEVHFIDKAEVERMMTAAELMPTGLPMGEINTEAIEMCMKRNPLIRNAECFKTNDNKIKLKIEQRIPILRVMSFFGNYYVDKEGKAMPVSSNYSARLTIASGYIEKQFAEGELYKFALFLRNDSLWNAQIQQIDVQQNHQITLIPTVGTQRIVMGKIDNFEQKMGNLRAFYLDGCNRFGWNKYKTINLRYNGQVICSAN